MIGSTITLFLRTIVYGWITALWDLTKALCAWFKRWKSAEISAPSPTISWRAARGSCPAWSPPGQGPPPVHPGLEPAACETRGHAGPRPHRPSTLQYSNMARQRARRQLVELDRTLARLSAEQREVLLLVGLEGMDYESVAQILGVPIGTVRSRLSRGRERLRELMGRDREPQPTTTDAVRTAAGPFSKSSCLDVGADSLSTARICVANCSRRYGRRRGGGVRLA
jgi:RNA polymerase sigma factor (sigma-70 family)